jgi:hypothetical protein
MILTSTGIAEQGLENGAGAFEMCPTLRCVSRLWQSEVMSNERYDQFGVVVEACAPHCLAGAKQSGGIVLQRLEPLFLLFFCCRGLLFPYMICSLTQPSSSGKSGLKATRPA